MNKNKVKVEGEGEQRKKRITLSRAGFSSPQDREVSDLKAGQFTVGQRVMIAVKDDCAYRRSDYLEFEVVSIAPCNRFGGGRETVTFERVKEGGAK